MYTQLPACNRRDRLSRFEVCIAALILGALGVAAALAQEGGPYPTGLPSYAQPASALLPLVASSGKGVLTRKYTEVGANLEGSFLAYQAQEPGDSLTQEFQVERAGVQEVVAWLPKGPRCGTFVILLDGERLGPEQDGYAAEATGPTPIELGEHDLAAGPHKVKFLVTGRNAESAGSEVWIDAYVVRPKPAGRFIDLWEVAGPYGGDGLAATAPPEGAFWRQVSAEHGRVNFVKWMGAADNAAAWARATVTAPTDMETTLWVGSDDGVTVWLNGEKVHEHLEARPALPDQDRVKVRLKQGENKLLLRVNNLSLGWELLVRPQDPDGRLTLPGAPPRPAPAAEVEAKPAVPLGEAVPGALPDGEAGDGEHVGAEKMDEGVGEADEQPKEKEGGGPKDRRNPIDGQG